MIRHNLLSSIEQLPTKLEILHISSNRIQNIDFIITCSLKNLTHVYVNSNQLTHLPHDLLLDECPKLQRLVISHNATLTNLPSQMWEYINEKSNEKDGDDAISEM